MALDPYIAREAMRDAVYTYVAGVDNQDYNLAASVFAQDGVFVMIGAPEDAVGPRAIAKALAQRGSARGTDIAGNFQQHHITSSQIKFLDECAAEAVHYILAITELGLDHAGRYIDLFRRVGDDWRIARRSTKVDWIRKDSRYLVFREQ